MSVRSYEEGIFHTFSGMIVQVDRYGSEYKRSNLHDDEESGRPSVINEDLMQRDDERVKDNKGS